MRDHVMTFREEKEGRSALGEGPPRSLTHGAAAGARGDRALFHPVRRVDRTMRYTAEIIDSLRSFGDAEVDAVTAGSNIFLDRRWFRLLDSVDLASLVRGELSLRYVVIRAGGTLVAVCPFFITRSPSIYYHYSLEKFFFLSWQGDLARMNPDTAAWSRHVARTTDAYRKLARLLRTGIEGWVLAASPLSFRGGIACREMPAEERRQVHAVVIQALKDVARAERLPLCFYGVEDKNPIQDTLREQAFEEVFLMFDNRLDLGIQRLDQYLDRFAQKVRRNLKYEMRKAEKQGFRFDLTSDIAPLGAEFEAFYEATYSKYGEEYINCPASYWGHLQKHLGAHVEAVVARKEGAPVGFCVLLQKAGEVFVYRMGRNPEPGGQEPPVYFSLILYEPIKRAVETGAQRMWLGGGAWDVKRRRGAYGFPLYNYFWFPNLRSRAMIGSFLALFSRLSRDQMTRVVVPAQDAGEGEDGK